MRVAAILVVLFSIIALMAHASSPVDEPAYSPAALKAHVEFLADDLLEGRAIGTRGYELAARYVATRFDAAGLNPPAVGGRYQRVPLIGSRLSTTQPPKLVVGGREFVHRSDVLMNASVLEASQAVEADVVFAGYCIDKPDQGSDDYAGLDVKGKIVACLQGFPKGMPSEIGAHLASRKTIMLQERGSIGLLTIRTLQSAKAFSWDRALEEPDRTSAWVQADGTAFREAPKIRFGGWLNTPAAEALFAGAPRTLADILAEADRAGGKPKGFALTPRVKFTRESEMTPFDSVNVLALLPGSDPALAGEVVLLMAHLDHLGMDPNRAGDKIFNGAMDNAAGVAVLLEVARAMAALPVKPKRPILFAAVTGEESGLLGSQYLARNPAVANATVVAVVALDMPILLYDFTDVIVFGAEQSTLGPIIARATQRVGIQSSPDPMPEQGGFTRSDHYSFVKEGVPGVHLMTGFANGGEKIFRDYLATHYHRPSDQLDLPFNWDAAAKFARLNDLIAREIANQPARPLWYRDSLFGITYAPGAAKAARATK